MLRRHEIAGAAQAALQAEAVHSALAPLLCGESGLSAYRGFLERMNAIIRQDAGQETDPASAAYAAIEARAAQKPIAAILDDPETQRRLAAISRGEKP